MKVRCETPFLFFCFFLVGCICSQVWVGNGNGKCIVVASDLGSWVFPRGHCIVVWDLVHVYDIEI